MKFKTYLAGHEFGDNTVDCCCIRLRDDKTACYVTRATCFTFTENDVGKPNRAHVLTLSQGEYSEIKTERETYQLYCEKIMEAIRGG